MALPTLSEINDAAIRDAAHNIIVERGMAREMAMRSGPGTSPPSPQPRPAHVAPTAAPAPAPQPEKPVGWGGQRPNGWDRRASSMAALDAARREREAKGGRS